MARSARGVEVIPLRPATIRRADLPALLHVTTDVDYAVRALVVLARAPAPPCKITTLHSPDMSLPVLQQALCRLRGAGIVVSRRGPLGGYALARDAASISLADVIAALRPGPDRRERRPDESDPWRDVARLLEETLERTSIAALANGQPRDASAAVTG